jgi:hypothetical protein
MDPVQWYRRCMWSVFGNIEDRLRCLRLKVAGIIVGCFESSVEIGLHRLYVCIVHVYIYYPLGLLKVEILTKVRIGLPGDILHRPSFISSTAPSLSLSLSLSLWLAYNSKSLEQN